MNEGVFGQYSVFCVFGSVVGCVVVPLIAQVLQQQSMECMILSAIVLSLTAAHLNKKCVSGNQNSKVTVAKEYDKRKSSQNKRNKYSPVPQTHNSSVSKSLNKESRNNESHCQQFEHLKIVQMEKRLEEKKLRKIQKREEKLKRREEENRKQKELEEKYKLIKEKRYKENREKQSKHKVTCDDSFEKLKANDWTKNLSYSRFNQFESTRNVKLKDTSMHSSISNWRPKFNNVSNLVSRNPNITASCSSLSSISSIESSSSSPVPASPPFTKSTWANPSKSTQAKSCWNKIQPDLVETIGSQLDNCSKLLSDTCSGLPSLPFASSSLFSGSKHEHNAKKACTTDSVAEYKLFGPQKVDEPPLSVRASMF